MADDLITPTPSSPPAPSPAPSPAPAPPVGAVPTPPAGDQSQTPSPPSPPAAPAVARPEWATDSIWDAQKNELKADAIKDALSLAAAETIRKSTLPQPGELKFEPSKEFQPPQGIVFEIDANDPLIPQAQQALHDIMSGKLTGQAAMSKLVDLYAAGKVGEQATLKSARDAEHAKLGVNSTARITALNTFLEANGVADLKPMMVTASIVQALEKLALKSAGSSTFSQSHRDNDAPGKLDDAAYDKLSFSEKRAYAEKHQQPAQQMNGR